MYCFSSCEESFCHWSLCFSVTQRGTLEAQIFWHPKFSATFWTTWCSVLVSVAISLIVTHPFSLMSWVFPLFWYSSWATSMVLVSDVWFPIFKVLFLSSATAGARADISMYALKSCTNICCWDFLPSKKYCTLPERGPTSHSVTLSYDHMTGVGDVIFILVWDCRWN